MYRSSPYAGSGPEGTFDGNVPIGWATDSQVSPFGNRYAVVCSATSDANVKVASVSVPPGQTTAGGTAATCPTGKRAVSGGLTTVGANQKLDNHMEFSAPVGDVTELAGIATGAVSRSWFADGKGTNVDASSVTYQVLAVCITDQPLPRDTTPPDTVKGKGPSKKTSSTKAKLTFSSEPGATFTCKLDKKKAKACTSPYKLKKLKPGKHKLTVTAADPAGNADPTPVVFKWKVLAKGRVTRR
jgi:hypothetical protein